MKTLSATSRTLSMVLIPVFTLLLGWQVGVHAEQQQNIELQRKLEMLYSGATQSGSTLGDPEKEVDLGLLWGTWRLLQSHYIGADELNTNALVMGAVTGLVKAVGDPYTVFMTPTENTDFRDSLSGHLQGIGAELDDSDETIKIVRPLKGSPAERAGILPNDIVVKVNDEDITGQKLQEVISKIRGQKGTRVKLTIFRESADDLLEFTITRDDITVPSVSYEVKQTATGSVGYLEINQFGSETTSEVRGYVSAINPTELKGLVVDLRFNGGGYLDAAVDIVSMFQKEGKVVSVEGRGTDPQRHYVSGNTILPDIPLVILQNQGSASASEIMAGALQDYKRATVIGMKSFGKGTVQEVLDLPGGSSLRVTVAKWLTPDGHDIGKLGITPDIVVERVQADVDANRDPQLEAALEFLTEGSVNSVRTGTGSTSYLKADLTIG